MIDGTFARAVFLNYAEASHIEQMCAATSGDPVTSNDNSSHAIEVNGPSLIALDRSNTQTSLISRKAH
jgi:hypothetical protein